ncbi:hypothetical protein [Pandoraea sp. CB10b_02]|uniref:hypothetical protein n=1 Tax=Pandoraea sp. CB10b_02 TaxID=2014535 RepID=UPI00257EEE0F|nr:hypothetical protein [Pandoraea sp. CB10b_02]
MTNDLGVFSITTCQTHFNVSPGQSGSGASAALLDEAMLGLAPAGGAHGGFRMRASDTVLPIFTHARLTALTQHFITASAHTTIFALARASEALDAGSNHKTLTLEHRAASVGTGVLCASAALDFLTAVGTFLNRSKSAKDIKDAQWLPSLAGLSATLRPFTDHFKTLQNGISNVALFSAVGSIGALWATRESLREPPTHPSPAPEPTPASTPMPDVPAPSASNRLEYAQLGAAIASTTLRAVMPPIVSTCITLDEAKRKRHEYELRDGPNGLHVAHAEAPVTLTRFTRDDTPPILGNWA